MILELYLVENIHRICDLPFTVWNDLVCEERIHESTRMALIEKRDSGGTIITTTRTFNMEHVLPTITNNGSTYMSTEHIVLNVGLEDGKYVIEITTDSLFDHISYMSMMIPSIN